MPDAAGRCAGCNQHTLLRPFDNGRAYCPRCAEEVTAMGWAKEIPNANH